MNLSYKLGRSVFSIAIGECDLIYFECVEVFSARIRGRGQTSEQDEASFELRWRESPGGSGSMPPPPPQEILKSGDSEMLF